jgi:hypothetical protein
VTPDAIPYQLSQRGRRNRVHFNALVPKTL